MKVRLHLPLNVSPRPMHVIRYCNDCDKEAEFDGYDQNDLWIMRCSCGRIFRAKIGRLERWTSRRVDIIDFYIRRKSWARKVARERNLKKGESTLASFEKQTWSIKIGPRGGIRIS